MSKAPDLSIVIPLFNEVQSVPELQREIETALSGRVFEIVFVDDASTDGTSGAIRLSDGVRVIRFTRNEGQSAAMLAGMRAARGAVIVLLDGDLQNNPADIPALLAALDAGADLVCGYRVHRADTLSKRITSRVANAVRSRFIGDGVRDAGCTFKVLRRECVDALVPFRGMHRFIPALIKNAGYRVVEVPVHHRPRKFGISKYGLGNRAVVATIDMLGVTWLQSRRLTWEVTDPITR